MKNPKELAIDAELKDLDNRKAELIATAQYMGVKEGTLGELVNQECMAILEAYREMVEEIHRNP